MQSILIKINKNICLHNKILLDKKIVIRSELKAIHVDKSEIVSRGFHFLWVS